MTVAEAFKTFDQLPHKFTLEDGRNFEHTTMHHSDGVWYAYVFFMNGNRRELHSYATGDTESEAIQNLVLTNTLQ